MNDKNRKYITIALAAILAAAVAIVGIGLALAAYRETVGVILAFGLIWLICNFDKFSSRKARCEQEQKNRDKAYLWLLWDFWQYFSSNENLPFQPILDCNEFGNSIEHERCSNHLIIRLHVVKSNYDAAKWNSLLPHLVKKHIAHFLFITQNPSYRLAFWDFVDNSNETTLVFLAFDDGNSYNNFFNAAQTQPKARTTNASPVDEDF